MPPVKPKKNKRESLPAPQASTAPTTPSVTAAVAPLASAGESAHSLKVSAARIGAAAQVIATEVADQLHSAAIHLLRRLRVRDRETNVGPAQLSALSVLVFGGPKSLGELADAEQVRPPTMSRVVASLQRSGMIRRHPTDDGRRVRLEATPKGVSLMWEARKRRVESLANVVSILPENEKQQLRAAITLLQQVIRNL
jgi:DNA-binding MarR family transcriptional regulator